MKKRPVTKQFARRPAWVWIVGILGIAAALLVMSGCGGPVPGKQSPGLNEIDKGQAIAEIICSSCHAVGLGDSSAHSDATPFRDIFKKYPIEALAEALIEGIVVGTPTCQYTVFSQMKLTHSSTI